MKFHRIDSNRNGFITCEEAYNWSEESFLGKLFDSKNVIHPFNTSDALRACEVLRSRETDGQKWPALLLENIIPITEIPKDGQIDPREFDDGIRKLSEQKRNDLMKEVLKHPLIHSIG